MPWTKLEEKRLAQQYYDTPNKQLAIQFGRSAEAVKKAAHRCGLTKDPALYGTAKIPTNQKHAA